MRKQMTTMVSLLLVLILALTPLQAWAEASASPVTSGIAGDNITWRFEDGTVFLEGTGETYNYDDARWEADTEGKTPAPWTDAFKAYRSNYLETHDQSPLFRMSVGEGITRLGDNTFLVGTWGTGEIFFRGDLPEINENMQYNSSISAIIAHYPAGNPTFTEETRTYYSHSETWVWVDSNGFADGQCGDNVRFQAEKDVVTISGSGPMFLHNSGDDGYNSLFVAMNEHVRPIREIIIEEGVTAIGHYDFSGLHKLTKLTIPESVDWIGNCALGNGCPIAELVIPGNLRYFGSYNMGRANISGDPDHPIYLDTAIYFKGHAPEQAMAPCIGPIYVEEGRDLSIYYPKGDPTWTDEKKNDICGSAAWKAIAYGSTPFLDVSAGRYYEQPVQWAVDKGITNGITDNRFGPDEPCTRAQIVTFLWRNAGSPKMDSVENPFRDVKKGRFYYDAVLWAVENGIANGVESDLFGTELSCTRSQAASFIWRVNGSKLPQNAKNPFNDVHSGRYYYNAVLWAVENGITNGVTDTTFCPNDPCTRAQIVSFLYRASK